MLLTDIILQYLNDPTDENKAKYEEAYKKSSSVTILNAISELNALAVEKKEDASKYISVSTELLTYIKGDNREKVVDVTSGRRKNR